ncbi:MAG: patatin-like phospholipase family protein [Chloroflexia bacterium]
MSKTKVALVLSGGVSLGAYIAGALDELLRAFKAESKKYEIDIITGASAGATTGALIAHGLRYREGATALHDIWVDSIDITGLLAPDIPPSEPPSLLNPRRLRELAHGVIKWDDPADPGKRAPYCSPDLRVAMAITNTTGLPYLSRIKEPAAGREEEFVQYRHAEQESFHLDRKQGPTSGLWQRMIEVALASSAIPFVFPLVRLNRTAGDPDDDSQYIQKPSFEGEANFWYCDGGTFNNLPLDLVWYLTQKAGDRPAPAPGERIIIVVNPWRNDFGEVDPNPPRPNFLHHAFGLLGALMAESSAIEFQDEVVRVNKVVPAQPAPRAQTPGAPRPHAEPVPPAPRDFPGVPRPPEALLSDVALVMPTKDDKRLKGNHLHAMGAFLDRTFREYDFRRGAADARRVTVERLNLQYDSGRRDSFYHPDDDPNLQQDVSTYENLATIPSTLDPNRSVQQVFEDALDKRIEAVVDRWNPPGPNWFDALFVKAFVKSKLPEVWPQ